MKITSHFVIYGLIITLIACKTESEPSENKQSTPPPSAPEVSDSFKPASFETDQRVEKIKEIAPELQQLFEAHRQEKNIPGIAYGVVVDGELVVASAIGLLDREKETPATTTSAFRIASMTKSFTAMAILKLRDEGKLSLNDPVEKYIPEMAELTYLTSDAPVIRIKNLLTMTAGFPEDNPWGDRQLDEPDQMLMNMMAQGVSFSNPASYEYEYSNTGFALLGHLITRISGQPYQEYIKETILLPLHMEHTYWEYEEVPKDQLALGYRWEDAQWKPEPLLHDGAFGAMGGLITTIEDFSKYVSFHLSAWPPRSETDTGPVKRSTLREMHTMQFPSLNAGATDWNNEACAQIRGYGYGLRITENCHGLKSVAHGGALPGFGSSYVFYPEYGVGMMAFGNLTYTTPWPQPAIEQLLFEKIGLQPRKLPVSSILEKRKEQVARLIQNWNADLEEQLLAENFLLDKSREHRQAEIQQLLNQAGAIQEVGEMEPRNQLRGTFDMKAENGLIEVSFTLTPEKDPKVQRLDVSFIPK